MCVTTSYIQDDIMIVFTMAFKCVLKILKTGVNFTGLQEENYFCSRKMFTSRKLTGVETLLLLSITFQLNENTNTCIVNSEYSDCIPHPNTHTHSNIFNIYVFKYMYYSKIITNFLRHFPSPMCEVAGSKFAMSCCCLITKLHSVSFQTTVMNVHNINT